MNNPHQFNYTQQLEHRLRMIQDDLNTLRQFIYANELNEVFEKKSKITGDPANCNLLNIEVACDLSNDESLSWGMMR
jgi:hypothetical protein